MFCPFGCSWNKSCLCEINKAGRPKQVNKGGPRTPLILWSVYVLWSVLKISGQLYSAPWTDQKQKGNIWLTVGILDYSVDRSWPSVWKSMEISEHPMILLVKFSDWNWWCREKNKLIYNSILIYKKPRSWCYSQPSCSGIQDLSWEQLQSVYNSPISSPIVNPTHQLPLLFLFVSILFLELVSFCFNLHEEFVILLVSYLFLGFCSMESPWI